VKKYLLILTCLFLVCSVFAAPKTETKYVCVKSAAVKEGTGLLAKTVAFLDYGTKVLVVKIDGKNSFIQVADDKSIEGWIPTASLTKKQVTQVAMNKSNGSNIAQAAKGNVVGSSGSTGASDKELALAGKGFSEGAEKAFKASHANIDFGPVDDMEMISVSDKEIMNFIVDGKLKTE
jgi:uncharacterized protein YgiM (DUF1202 family)